MNFVLALAISTACPDLTGRWHCTYSNTQPVQTIEFSQSPVPGGMLYHMTTQTGRTEDFLVDGVTRTKTSGGWTQHETYSCVDANSFTEVSDLVASDGTVVFNRLGTVALTGANTLTGDRKTSVPWSSGSKPYEEITFTCQRQ